MLLPVSPTIGGKEVVTKGTLFRTARLRHEWCDFLADVPTAVEELRGQKQLADVFTFVEEIGTPNRSYGYRAEPTFIAVLPVVSFSKWWDEMGFKARNKVRKAQKCGVDVRVVSLDEDFARGVQSIYNESPVRQGRKFIHYGRGASDIFNELLSFKGKSTFVGSYFEGNLIGFMKLFHGNGVLRTVHIIATLAHRDKNVMDGLIAKAVELCDEKNAGFLHYGSWTDGGVGAFRTKHGFQRMEVARYYIPLGWRGEVMLNWNLHRPLRDRLPKRVTQTLTKLRAKWNCFHKVRVNRTFETGV